MNRLLSPAALRPTACAVSLLIFLFISACVEQPLETQKAELSVFVGDTDGRALAGVEIRAPVRLSNVTGKSADFTAGWTDSAGRAVLPGRIRGKPAWFLKEGYTIGHRATIAADTVRLVRTPASAQPIGRVVGEAIGFRDGLLTTVGYGGGYYSYAYTDTTVNLLSTRSFPYHMRYWRIDADTLWFSVPEGSIHAFDISDPGNPVAVRNIVVGGPIGPFLVTPELVITANMNVDGSDKEPVRIFMRSGWDYLCDAHQVGNLPNICGVSDMMLIGDSLLLLGYERDERWGGVHVVDISDPSQPAPRPGYRPAGAVNIAASSFHDPWAVLVPYFTSDPGSLSYDVLDVSDPAAIRSLGVRPVPLSVNRVVGPDLVIAAGEGCLRGYTAILQGDLLGGLATTAVIKDTPIWLAEGYAPPFFLINGTLRHLHD